MITTKDLESIGWEISSTANNGGSHIFRKKESFGNKYPFFIQSHAENFLIDSPKKEEITISKINQNLEREELWKGIPKKLEELKWILVETGADMEWLSEIRDKKIDIINGTQI